MKKITSIALRAVGLAMGIAIIVLSALGALNVSSGVSMLGIGLAALALNSLQESSTPTRETSKE